MNQSDPLAALQDLEQQLAAMRASIEAGSTGELQTAQQTIAALEQALAQAQAELSDQKEAESARFAALRAAVEGQLHGIYHELRRSSLQSLERVSFVIDCLDAAQHGAALPQPPRQLLTAIDEPTVVPANPFEQAAPPIARASRPSELMAFDGPRPPAIVEPVRVPAPTEPIPVPAVAESPALPIAAEPAQVLAQKLPEQKHSASPKPKPDRKKLSPVAIGFRIAGAALAAGGFAFLWNIYSKPITDTGSVAGVQTSAASQTTTSQYPNAEQGQIPFEQTEWQSLNEPTFGIKALDFAKNASDLVQSGGSNNIFFVSKNYDGLVSHIFKLSRFEPDGDPVAWIERMKLDLRNEYSFDAGKLNGVDAIVGSPKEKTSASGTMYLLSATSSATGTPKQLVYQVWAKQLPSADPNAARVARMLGSIKLGD